MPGTHYLPAGMPAPVPEPDGLDRRTGRALARTICASNAARPVTPGCGGRSGCVITASLSISSGSESRGGA